MTWRKAHGRAAELGNLVVVETAPADEQPGGRPAPARQPAARDKRGRLPPSPGTTALAAKGGKARAEAQQLARLLGFSELPEGHTFHRYHRLAREWRDAHATSVAGTVGGGELSPGVSSIIASAALTLAASRYLYDQAIETANAELFPQAARLADQSRSALLTAHELAAREAKARHAATPPSAPWLVPAGSSGAEGRSKREGTPTTTDSDDASTPEQDGAAGGAA